MKPGYESLVDWIDSLRLSSVTLYLHPETMRLIRQTAPEGMGTDWGLQQAIELETGCVVTFQVAKVTSL